MNHTCEHRCLNTDLICVKYSVTEMKVETVEYELKDVNQILKVKKVREDKDSYFYVEVEGSFRFKNKTDAQIFYEYLDYKKDGVNR